jgi:hypothetical protein
VDDIRTVCAYVQERWNAGDYKKYIERHQDPLPSAIQDIDGKIGELIAWRSLLSYGIPTSRVDFKVYPPNEKRFAHDLVFKKGNLEIGFGVKTHTLEACEKKGWKNKGWPSWIFQREDNTIFGSGDSCVVFVCVSVGRMQLSNEEPLPQFPSVNFDHHGAEQVWGGTGRVMSCNWKSDLTTVFDSPRKENIAKTKRAVYLSRLIQRDMVSSPIDCLRSRFPEWEV